MKRLWPQENTLQRLLWMEDWRLQRNWSASVSLFRVVHRQLMLACCYHLRQREHIAEKTTPAKFQSLQQSITNVWRSQPVSNWNASGPKPSQTPGWRGCCPCPSLLSWLLQNRIFQGSGHCEYPIHRTFWKWRAAYDHEIWRSTLNGSDRWWCFAAVPRSAQTFSSSAISNVQVQVWLSVKQWSCRHSARNVARSQGVSLNK